MSPRVARVVTRAADWFGRLVRSPYLLLIGVLMVGSSALLGNLFQNADRTSLKADNVSLKEQVSSLTGQLDRVKGEQECRSQIASESELYSGQLNVALGQFVVAARAGNRADIDRAVKAISSASDLLVPALDARQHAVETCAGASAPTPTTTSTTTTTTLAPSNRKRIKSTSPSTVPGTTTSSTIYRTPGTTNPDCTDVLGLVCIPLMEAFP